MGQLHVHDDDKKLFLGLVKRKGGGCSRLGLFHLLVEAAVKAQAKKDRRKSTRRS